MSKNINNIFVKLKDGTYGFALNNTKVLIFDSPEVEQAVVTKVYSQQSLSEYDLDELAVELQQSLLIKELDEDLVEKSAYNFSDIYESDYESEDDYYGS